MIGARAQRAVRGLFGTAIASYLTLAVLVLGSTFIAMAGPRQSLHIQTQALQDQLRTVPPVDTAVLATADWNAFTSSLAGVNGVAPLLYSTQLGTVTRPAGQRLRRGRAAAVRTGHRTGPA